MFNILAHTNVYEVFKQFTEAKMMFSDYFWRSLTEKVLRVLNVI